MIATERGGASGTYLELVRRHPLRPIRTDEENDAAIAVAYELSKAGESRTLEPGERDYLDVLTTLIERFEDEHYPVPAGTPAEMLLGYMEAREVTQAQVVAATGMPASTLSEILSGKRLISPRNRELLGAFFRVDPSTFA